MNRFPHQRGASLVEGLVALLVLSLSLVATVRLQTWLRQHSDLARERSEAVQQAQQVLGGQRGFHDLAAFDQPPSGEAVVGTRTTSYRVQHETSTEHGLKTGQVTVLWQPRGGEEQRVQIASSVARLAPVHSALLEVPPQDRVLAGQRVQPTPAVPLLQGRSLVRPSTASPIAWVVDTTTGEIQQQCRIDTIPAPQRELTAADLADCTPLTARLLRGFIRFALSATPDPLRANDPPLPLSVHAAGQRCESEAIAADGERYLAYACAIPHDTEPSFTPQGWSFGLSASDFRACRYPGAARAPRNYLVVRGDIACPRADPPHNGGPVVTVQHQP
ncbi:MAG TPA: hypothetical protein VGD46_19970 [Rhizobacter sp.]